MADADKTQDGKTVVAGTVGAIVLAAAVALLLWNTSDCTGEYSENQPTQGSPRAAQANASKATSEGTRTLIDRVPVATGIVRDSRTKAAIPAAQVTILALPDGTEGIRSGNRYKVKTDQSGAFSIGVPAAARSRLLLHVHAAGYERWAERVPEPGNEGKQLVLGTIYLRRVVVWRGRVVDSSGSGVPNAHVTVQPASHKEPQEGTHKTVATSLVFYTDAKGGFEHAQSIVEGTWELSIAGCSVISPKPLQIAGDGREDVYTTIVVRRRLGHRSIKGQVLDASGIALVGVTIVAVGSRRTYEATSETNGMFEVFCDDDDNAEAGLRVPAGEAPRQGLGKNDPRSVCRYAEYSAKRTFPWGTDGVVIPLTDGRELVVRVLCEHDNRPVENFVAQCFARIEAAASRVVRIGDARTGEARFPGTIPGRNVIVVLPEQKDLAPYIGHHVVQGVSNETVLVKLSKLSQTTVRVVDTLDEPVVGTSVELVESNGLATVELGVPACRYADMYKKAVGVPYLCDSGRTNSEGRVELLGRPSLSGCWVRVLGPGHPPKMFQVNKALWRGSLLELRVDRGHVVEGVVLGLEQNELRSGKYGISLRRSVDDAQEAAVHWPRRRGLTIPLGLDGAGRFRIESVARGTWCLLLAKQDAYGRFHTRLRELAVIDVPRTDPQVLEVHARVTSTGTVSGTIVGWSDLDRGTIQLLCRNAELRGAGALGRAFTSSISDSGRYSFDAVPPTNYVLDLQMRSDEQQRSTTHRIGEGLLKPGAQAYHDFRIPRNTLTLRIRHSGSQAPAQGRLVQLVSERGLAIGEGTSDASGIVHFTAIADGDYGVCVLPRNWNSLRYGSSHKKEAHRVRVANVVLRGEDKVVRVSVKK